MSGEFGYTKQEECEFLPVFAEQALRRFGPTHEAENFLREMGSVKYRGMSLNSCRKWQISISMQESPQ